MMATAQTPAKRTPGARLLGAGYALALRAIADGGATWHTVAERCGVRGLSARTLVHGMRTQGVIYVCGWVQVPSGRRRQWTAVYALGPGQDVPPTVFLRAWSGLTPPELRGFCDLVAALKMDSWHGKGLADYLGQSVRVVRNTVRVMHKLRLVRIESFMDRAGRPGVRPPLFTWGPDTKDAPRPKRRTDKEVWQYHNAIRAARAREAKLLHAMVHGVAMDGRGKAVQVTT
jgi:hypothetical protein